MNFATKITQLKDIIDKQLSPLITNDYVLYDLPYHNNIGDLLIWEGELSFLQKKNFKMLGYSSYYENPQDKITHDTIILLHGGGNFGDLWRKSQDFKLHIIQKYSNNPIIIMPQTVFYEKPENITLDARIMGKHKNLVICARDLVSYNFLSKHFNNQILLLPDMAFCIHPEKLNRFLRPEKNKTLYLKRSDKEFKTIKYTFQNKYPLTISDWPTMENTDWAQVGLRATSLLRKLGMPQFMNWYGMHIYRPCLIKKGVQFISQYKEIYTTRLHVAILSILLNKPFHFLDNSYGKNRTFFNTWLSDLDKIDFIEK